MRSRLLLAAIAVCISAEAHAQPTEIDRDAARAAVQQGDERMEEKDYKGALKAYIRADDIMGVPTTSIEVGRVSQLLNRLVEAHEAYERAANYPYKEGEPEPFTRARKEAKDLAHDLAERIPTVSIDVRGLLKDVEPQVTLDDKYVQLGATIPLNPGPHEIVATADGYVTHREDIELEEWDKRLITVRLKQEIGTLWPMVWIGYGLAGAGVIVGAITGGVSLSAASDAKDLCPDGDKMCEPKAQSFIDQSLLTAHISTASFVVAGVAAIVGTAGLFISLSAESDAADVGLGPGSVELRLRF